MNDNESSPFSFLRGSPGTGRTAEVFRCQLRPEELEKTELDDIKFCGQCSRRVYQVKDINGFVEAVAADRCVWIAPEDQLGDSCEPLFGMPIFSEPQLSGTFDPILLRPIAELDLSARLVKLLSGRNISHIGDLVQLTENDLLRFSNVGRQSLNEIRETLAMRGLTLPMKLTGWPPASLDDS